MKKWTKLLAVPMTLALLTACGGGGSGDTSSEESTEQTSTNEASDDTSGEETGSEESSNDVSSSEESADTTSGASQVADTEQLQEALQNGPWIVLFQNDIETDQDLTMAGGFTNSDGEAQRKLGLYSTDENGDIAETYTLSAPSITIQNENTRIVNGTVEADLYVEGNELTLEGGATVDGDITFASQEYADSANLEDGTVTGEITVEGEEGQQQQ